MPSAEEVAQTVEELVDEVKLVSYKHLSRHAGIPCNASKQ